MPPELSQTYGANDGSECTADEGDRDRAGQAAEPVEPVVEGHGEGYRSRPKQEVDESGCFSIVHVRGSCEKE